MKKVIMLLSNPFKPDLRVLREAITLSNIGFSVTIIAWDREGKHKDLEYLEDGRVEVRRVNLLYKGKGSGLIRFLRRIIYTIAFNLIAFSNASKILRKETHKIVHCHDLDTIIAGLMLKYFFFKPSNVFLIFDSHEYWPGISFLEFNIALKKLVKVLHDILIKLVDAVVTVSEALNERIPLPIRRVKIVYPNIFLPSEMKNVLVSSEESSEGAYFGERIRIFYFGSLHKARGLLQLLKLGLRLRKSPLNIPVEIIIAGTGPLESVVRSAANKSIIKYLGWVPEKEVRRVLSKSHFVWILYNPQIENNRVALPNKFFLSMLYGKPIVTNEGLLIAKYVQEAKIGFVVNYFTADVEMYELLDKVIRYPAVYYDLVNKVYKNLREIRKTIKKYMRNLKGLYYLAIRDKKL